MPSPDSKTPGVIVSPPSRIRDSIKVEVERALAQIPPGKQSMAQVDIHLKSGINVAYAYKTGKGWTVGAYVGKTWSGPVEGGASVTKIW